jgi:HEPN domain-containing protein
MTPISSAGTLLPAPTPKSALSLLTQATHTLADAERQPVAGDRYTGAYTAALRAAAAVVAARAKPDDRRRRPQPVWALLAALAPDLREWASFFAAGSRTRTAVQAGVTRLVTDRDADDLVRQAGQFIELAERAVRGDQR